MTQETSSAWYSFSSQKQRSAWNFSAAAASLTVSTKSVIAKLWTQHRCDLYAHAAVWDEYFFFASHNIDNGGATTSRQDWVLNVKAVMDGEIAFPFVLKVQVVATPGRKTKRNGPVAGPSTANIMEATAVENVRVRRNLHQIRCKHKHHIHPFCVWQGENDDQLNAQLLAWTREEKMYAIANINSVRKLKRKK